MWSVLWFTLSVVGWVVIVGVVWMTVLATIEVLSRKSGVQECDQPEEDLEALFRGQNSD